MKICVVSVYFEPEVTPYTHLIADLCRDWTELGAEVTVVTSIPSRGIDENTRNEYKHRLHEDITPNLHIKRAGLQSREKKNFISRGLRYLLQTYLLYRTAKETEADVYFLVSTPPFLGIAGAFLADHSPAVYNLQDIFPDSFIHAGKSREGSLLSSILRQMEQYIYKNNTHIITISEDMKKTLLSRGVEESKISVIYNWTDSSKVCSINRKDNILFQRFNLPEDKFYVSYAGNIGLLQNLQTVVDGAEILKSYPDIHFVIIGDGVWKAELNKQIQKKALQNISVFSLQPEVDHVYSLGDIEIVSTGKNVSKSALPSKTWNIMAVSRPIICETDTNSELYKIISDNQCGICIEPGDSKSFAEAIIKLYKNREQIEAFGSNGRKYVGQYLSRQHATREYFACLKQVVQRNRGEE